MHTHTHTHTHIHINYVYKYLVVKYAVDLLGGKVGHKKKIQKKLKKHKN